MNGATSPAGDPHPGDIEHHDHVTDTVETWHAKDMPQELAWVDLDDEWVPVVRVERTGTPQRFEIITYGPGGQLLEVTSASA